MKSIDLYDSVVEKAKEFGLKPKNDDKGICDSKGNAIIRKNLGNKDSAAYFGFINPDEATSGPYSDFSFVVFPDDPDDVKTCIVCLAVGSSGFRNDYQLAVQPGLRRMFLRLASKKSFFKTSFDDIESTSSDLLKELRSSEQQSLADSVEKYKNVLPASCIVDVSEEKGMEEIYRWLATYAEIRSWGSKLNKGKRDRTLKSLEPSKGTEYENEITDLLEKRKYLVLQGAPGTGKTYTALNISKKYDKAFFEQFHAETSYSDFVYGLEPDLASDTSTQPRFKAREGILYQAIETAEKLKVENKKVLLIIDEINRANLSNVLGPVFYLFEHQAGERQIKVRVGDKEYAKLPDNLHVIATMNTADRSLAVIDFALRRRFAWYTLRPHKVTADAGKVFMEEVYNKFADVFFWYATDEELNLQPGQSYFIVQQNKKDAEMKERMIYELMPLIKEYLAEGYLLKAKDTFCDLFFQETGKLVYE